MGPFSQIIDNVLHYQKGILAETKKCNHESMEEIKLCSGLNANEIQSPYDKHHKVSSLVKSNQNTHNSIKYEVM